MKGYIALTIFILILGNSIFAQEKTNDIVWDGAIAKTGKRYISTRQNFHHLVYFNGLFNQSKEILSCISRKKFVLGSK